ncbi:MAG: HDOD domain-containing protein [Candidatus Hydrogenedentes bacterium]|nr:HDOD domain-containing protein [Candidatus Hydrogenedentota bacterium]
MARPDVRDTISKISSLPTLPSILTQILATAADPDSSAIDLGRHIASDQSLSAALLRLVNSASYGHYREIKDIATAIVMLGFFEVRNLALSATCFRHFAGSRRSASDYDRTQLWRHSVASAMAAERLAKRLHVDGGSAFVGGLLHDIGKVVFDVLYPDEFRRAYQKARLERKYIREVELESFDLDHSVAGELLAEHWNLPHVIVESIRFHHEPHNALADGRLASLTSWADFVTYQSGLGENSNGRDTEAPEESPVLYVPEAVWKTVMGELETSHERIDSFLGVLRG